MNLTLSSPTDGTETLVLDLARMTPDEVKALADKLQFGMVISLVDSVNRLDTEADSINRMKDRLVKYIETKLKTDLESETLSYDDALAMFQKFSAYNVSVAEVKRKVFNGKDLLKVDTFSKQERAMMDLLRTVNTEEKKHKLMQFIETLDDFEQVKERDSEEEL